jgi:UDP-glucuronate decarboxylase
VTGPVNVGNPVEISVRELARKIIEKTGCAAPLEYRELPTDDPRQRRPDISLARRLIAWEPKLSLDEGLDRTIRYFRDLLARPPEEVLPADLRASATRVS